jgi:ParB/RepB/Spo0J family partition protein
MPERTMIQYVVEAVAPELLKRHPDNPRQKDGDESRALELANDLKANGLICPLIGYRDGSSVMLVDGHRRLDAACMVGMKALSVLICDRVPTRTEVLRLQARIDAHRHNFNAVELSDLLTKLQAETRCTVTELSQQIGKSQSFCTKLLALQRSAPELLEQLRTGKLDVERAYLIASSEPDFVKQVALVKQAATLSREELRQQVKRPDAGQVKVSSARLKMPSIDIDVRGKDLTLSCVVDALSETVRILKKGQSAGWDLSTQCRVLRDQAKQRPKSASR